ncbi:MAG: hypothetical protein JO053_09120 [Acidobacteria bacterium]|nr:hypothetical protein [Acidobacteriota bacterium]
MKGADRANLSRLREETLAEEAASSTEPLSIRVSPHGYLTALLLSTFLSALLFYLELDIAGFAVFAISWILIPFLALGDKIIFDGKRLIRSGLVPRAWNWFNRSRRQLRLYDIEQVETQAIRAARRGGNIFYRYRTTFRGKGSCLTIASGGDDFRRILPSVLTKLPENALDIRSAELRDHLAEPKEVLTRAEFARIPSAEVLEGTMRAAVRHRIDKDQGIRPKSNEDEERADELQSLANELRLSGYLLQALEAFRRALVLRPKDARLIFEFARCLHSWAGVSKDRRLERKAIAALRLSERRAGQDTGLLNQIAESYFQIGDGKRAGAVFQNVLDRFGDNFAAARGMAELALREGKIAHVIHHFASANRAAGTPSLRRWSRNETDYFSRLHDDEEYMEMEIGRVNLLETVETSKGTALRIAFIAFPLIIFGLIADDNLVADIGWAVSTVSLLIWVGLMVTGRMLSQRIPYEIVHDRADH